MSFHPIHNNTNKKTSTVNTTPDKDSTIAYLQKETDINNCQKVIPRVFAAFPQPFSLY
jgi:hypothetical protein